MTRKPDEAAGTCRTCAARGKCPVSETDEKCFSWKQAKQEQCRKYKKGNTMTKTEARQIQDAMDILAVALVNHGHRFSKIERREYQKAQRVLCRETERPSWDRTKAVA